MCRSQSRTLSRPPGVKWTLLQPDEIRQETTRFKRFMCGCIAYSSFGETASCRYSFAVPNGRVQHQDQAARFRSLLEGVLVVQLRLN
jgi:hypothetical protein